MGTNYLLDFNQITLLCLNQVLNTHTHTNTRAPERLHARTHVRTQTHILSLPHTHAHTRIFLSPSLSACIFTLVQPEKKKSSKREQLSLFVPRAAQFLPRNNQFVPQPHGLVLHDPLAFTLHGDQHDYSAVPNKRQPAASTTRNRSSLCFDLRKLSAMHG